MWRLYQNSKDFGSRPATVIGLQDTWVAYQFDSAVGYLGRYVEIKMEEYEGKGKHRKRKWTVEQVLAGRAEASKMMNGLIAQFIASGLEST